MNDRPKVQIQPSEVRLTAGAGASVDVRIVNMSNIVDTFEVSLVGAGHPGFHATPVEAKLLKGGEKTVQLRIQTRSDHKPPAGTRVVGIRVLSRSHPELSRVEELTISVLVEGQALLTVEPALVRGGNDARLRARVVNHSNQPMNLGFTGSDMEHAVAFQFSPPAVYIAPGETSDVTVTVAATPPFTGTDAHRTLQIKASGDGQALSGAATFTQSPRIGAGVLRVLGSLFAVLVIAGSIIGAALLIPGDDEPVVDAGVDIPGDLAEGPEVPQALQIQVPVLQGMPLAQAAAALAAAQLIQGPVATEVSELPAGSVIGSDPAPGTNVDPFSTVSVTISSGPNAIQQIAVPELAGQSLAQATALLSSACQPAPCLIANEQADTSDEVAAGAVIDTAPSGGALVDPGSAVSVIVSLGPDTEGGDSIVTPIVGEWTNRTPENGPIRHLLIEDVAGVPLITAVGTCEPACSLGKKTATFDGTSGSVSFSQGITTHQVAFRLEGQSLQVDTTSTSLFILFNPGLIFPIFPEIDSGARPTLPPILTPSTVSPTTVGTLPPPKPVIAPTATFTR